MTPEPSPLHVRRLTINTVALIGAQVGVRLASLMVILLLGRLLGPDGLGLYAMAIAAASLAVVFADAGVDTVTVRAMAAGRPAAAYLGGLVPLRLVLGLLATIAAAIGAGVLGYPPLAIGLTVAITIGTALEMLAGSLRAALRAAETMVSESALIVAGQGLRALGGGLALALGLGLAGFGVGVMLAGGGSLAIALLVVARRHGWPRPRRDWALWLTTMRQTAPVTLWLLLTQIGTRSDAIIIGQWWPAAEAGRFHAASGVLSGLNLVVAMALAALYPRLVRLRADESTAATWRLAAPVLVGGVALALAIALLAPLVIEPLLLLLLGDRFLGAGPPLSIMRWALLAYVISGLANVVLRARGDDSPLAWVALVGALLSLGLNLLLIPTQGAEGAAASSLAAEASMAVVSLWLLVRRALPVGRHLLVGGVIGGLAGGAGLLVAQLATEVWWQAAMAGIAVASAILLAAGAGWLLRDRLRRGRPARPGWS